MHTAQLIPGYRSAGDQGFSRQRFLSAKTGCATTLAPPPRHCGSDSAAPARLDMSGSEKKWSKGGQPLVRCLLVQESQRAIAALALQVAKGAGACGDKVALVVVDLGLGGEGALAGRRPPRAEDGQHVAVAGRLDELRGEGQRDAEPPGRRGVVEGTGKAAAESSSVISTPPCSRPLALQSSGRTFRLISTKPGRQATTS
jgi:hypothetical protein